MMGPFTGIVSGSPHPERPATARRWCPPTGRAGRSLGDAGSETVEIVIIVPVLMALLLLGLQLCLWGLAAHAVNLGVAEGGAAGRALGGSRQVATIVRSDVEAIAGSLVGSLTVDVHQLPEEFVAVSATGVVPTVFPGLRLRVSAVSAGPVQGFRATG